MRFYDASTAADLSVTADVLADVHAQAARSGVEIMVVGAAARDILISHVVGSPPQRATRDVDVAVAVASWRDVGRLTAGLDPVPHRVHTFSVRGVEVDVIPFGDIETDRTITWPNDNRMSVLGFQEAHRTAVEVRLPGGTVVAVASLPAQSLLKLIAWQDRRNESRRDAVDLKAILDAYHEGPYLDELYDQHEDLLIRYDFDPELAGAERMGREAGRLLDPRDLDAVTGPLDRDDVKTALVGHMGPLLAHNRALLSAYRAGLGATR